MSVKVLNVKSSGIFFCIIEGAWEFDNISINDPLIDPIYQEKLQNLVDDLQSNNFQEIHLETSLTNAFVHKVGNGTFEQMRLLNLFVHKVGNGTFEESNDPNNYELFATMKEWTSVLAPEA